MTSETSDSSESERQVAPHGFVVFSDGPKLLGIKSHSLLITTCVMAAFNAPRDRLQTHANAFGSQANDIIPILEPTTR